MKNPAFLAIAAALLISGCSSTFEEQDPMEIASENPMVSSFLAQHAGAHVDIDYFSTSDSNRIITKIRQECHDPLIFPTILYRLNISDSASGHYAIVWVDAKRQEVECALLHDEDYELSRTPNPGCASESGFACWEEQVYWYDSCGLPESLKERCEFGCNVTECFETPQEEE